MTVEAAAFHPGEENLALALTRTRGAVTCDHGTGGFKPPA